MMSRRSWAAAKTYVLAPLLIGAGLLLSGRRAGWACLGAAAAVLAFFRDPERDVERLPDVVYAAADGVVVVVDEVPDAFMPGGAAIRISTFLSLHNVHVNRSPVRGRVERIQEIQGRFAPALFSSSEENRRNRIEISGDAGPVVVAPKAGMIARRISTWIEAGDEVDAGDRIGLIHFGSRTDVLFPANSAEVLVERGDRVRAGLTPLARYHDRAGNPGDA